MVSQTDVSLRGVSVMRSFSKNSRRPRVEQLEDRCVPGIVLDLVANPVLPLSGGPAMDPLQADQTAHLPRDETTIVPGPAARPGDAPIPEPVASGLASGAESSSQPPSGASAAGIPVAAPGLSMEATEGIVRSESAHQVPFKGRLEGVVSITPLAPPFVSVMVNATGNATQLGQFTLAIPHTVNRSTRTAIGSYQFTAANGDTLSADFTGQATPTPTPGVLYIEEMATITGGTGRFAGATGSFTVERLFDTVAGTTTGSFEGTISVPVAGHH
jgi:hypothetical protein